MNNLKNDEYLCISILEFKSADKGSPSINF